MDRQTAAGAANDELEQLIEKVLGRLLSDRRLKYEEGRSIGRRAFCDGGMPSSSLVTLSFQCDIGMARKLMAVGDLLSKDRPGGYHWSTPEELSALLDELSMCGAAIADIYEAWGDFDDRVAASLWRDLSEYIPKARHAARELVTAEVADGS